MKYLFIVFFVIFLSGCTIFNPGFIPHTKSRVLEWEGVIKKDPLKKDELLVLSNVVSPKQLSVGQKKVIEWQSNLILAFIQNDKKIILTNSSYLNHKVLIKGKLDYWKTSFSGESPMLYQFLIVEG